MQVSCPKQGQECNQSTSLSNKRYSVQVNCKVSEIRTKLSINYRCIFSETGVTSGDVRYLFKLMVAGNTVP
jgi:hypothetical protein